MIILGLNAYHGDSSAALICDGRIVAAAISVVTDDPIFGSWTQAVIGLWDAAKGVKLRELKPEIRVLGEWLIGEKGHLGVSSMAFSADGKQLLSSGDGADVRLWDVATGRHLHCFRPDGRPDSTPAPLTY